MSFRLARELKELRDLPADSEVGATPLNDQGTHWEGWIKGPENTPYEGGKFFVDIVVPEGYPFTPLVCKFITKIWHPNVSSVTGVICLDILKTEWSPAQTIRTVLLSLQLLLCTPNPDDPQDGVVAQMYRRSVAEFEAEARKWTATYSTPVARGGAPAAPRPPPPFPFPDALTQLTEMGFPEEDSKRALVATKGDVGDAVAQLTA